VARRYDELFSRIEGVTTPHCPDWARHVYHLYVVRVQNREGLQKHLAEAKIDTGIHYPIPLHLQKAYENFGYRRGEFPVSEQVAADILSLPMFPQLTHSQQKEVAGKAIEFVTAEVGASR